MPIGEPLRFEGEPEDKARVAEVTKTLHSQVAELLYDLDPTRRPEAALDKRGILAGTLFSCRSWGMLPTRSGALSGR